MRKALMNVEFFAQRRERLKKLMGTDEAIVLFSGKAPVRSNDTHYKFRPHSNFFYLTGFEEQEAVLVFRPGQTPETVLFVQEKNELLETWEGFLFGEKGAQETFKVDVAYKNSELSDKLPELLSYASSVYHKIGEDVQNDETLQEALQRVLRQKGRKGHPLQNLKDPNGVISKLRVIKTEEEIEVMRKTCEISARAHVEVIKEAQPGVSEAYLEGVFASSVLKAGAKDVAYNSIVATGNNATTLHYVFNDQECQDGEILLVDAGSEYKYYAGDITRSFPVGKSFSETQKALYEKVLKVQKELIEMVKPGCTFKQLNEACAHKLTQVMVEEGLLSGDVDKLVENGDHKKYYPHSVGHFLGLDVHDVGYYEENGAPIGFEPGMVLTIEPGIYIPQVDTEAPEKFRGLGIRIEDDILVTSSGHEVLTSLAPKEVDELLKLKS